MGLDMYLTKKVEVYKKIKVLGEELVEGSEPSKFFIEDNNERMNYAPNEFGGF